MQENNIGAAPKETPRRFGCLQVFGLIVITVIITAGLTIFLFKTYLFPSEFKPVTLNPAEERALALKLEKIDSMGTGLVLHEDHDLRNSSESGRSIPKTPLEPEPYSEKGAEREIEFTERELNGLLAKNTDLADKLAIDLSENLISAKLLLPVDQDFPVLGGKILRFRSGMDVSCRQGKPVVILRGVTIMGVPVPNAWLGGMKNIDLVEKFGTERGFWKTFSDGVEDIKIEEGLLKVRLKE